MGKKSNKQRNKYEKNSTAVISGIAAIFFIVITAVYPMYLTKNRYLILTSDKTYAYWIFMAVAVFSMLFMLLFFKKSFYINNYYIKDEPERAVSVPEWALFAFLFFALASALVAAGFSWNKEIKDIVWLGAKDRHEGFLSFLCYGLTFFIIARFYKPKRLHLLILAGSAILISLYGVLQFVGIDIFQLFPYRLESLCDSNGMPLYGHVSAYFRTTLGNIDIVSAYCSFAVVLFAALFAVPKSKSKWHILYIAASVLSFALFLVADRDASKVSIPGAMVLLIPYWISDRKRFGKILIVLSGWCAVFAGYNAYVSVLKKRLERNWFFAPNDQNFLNSYTPKNSIVFIVLAVVLLAAGLSLVLLLKKWPEKMMKTAGIVSLPVMVVGGLLFVEIMGARWADQPLNIIWQAREMLHGRFDDQFGSGRGWIWKRAMSVLFKHPVFGTGPDTFYYALGDQLQSEAGSLFGTTFDKAHNIFLQIAVCMGIPALLSFAVFLVSLLVSAVKKAFDRPLLLAFVAAALSYMIQSFFCVEVPITTPLVWIAFGVVAGEVWTAKIGCEEVEL